MQVKNTEASYGKGEWALLPEGSERGLDPIASKMAYSEPRNRSEPQLLLAGVAASADRFGGSQLLFESELLSLRWRYQQFVTAPGIDQSVRLFAGELDFDHWHTVIQFQRQQGSGGRGGDLLNNRSLWCG